MSVLSAMNSKRFGLAMRNWGLFALKPFWIT
jgi:hypothetical protein